MGGWRDGVALGGHQFAGEADLIVGRNAVRGIPSA